MALLRVQKLKLGLVSKSILLCSELSSMRFGAVATAIKGNHPVLRGLSACLRLQASAAFEALKNGLQFRCDAHAAVSQDNAG